MTTITEADVEADALDWLAGARWPWLEGGSRIGHRPGHARVAPERRLRDKTNRYYRIDRRQIGQWP